MAKRRETRQEGSRAAAKLTFTSNEALFAWMEDEYLSELELGDLTPPPGDGHEAPPGEVAFTWDLITTTKRVPYRATASAVTVWSVSGGDPSKHAIAVLPADATADRAANGVHIVMGEPGRIELRCARLSFRRGRAESLPRTPRPSSEHRYFRVRTPEPPAVAAVLAAMGVAHLRVEGLFRSDDGVNRVGPLEAADLARAPADPRLMRVEAFDEQRALLQVWWEHDAAGVVLFVVRRDATDDEWRRAVRLPSHVPRAWVTAGFQFEGDDATWAREMDTPPN